MILKLTIVHVSYSNDLISSVLTSPTPFQSENVQLLPFIARVAKYQTINPQGLVSSAIGDILYSIYSSTTHGSIGDNLDQTEVYLELLSFLLLSFPTSYDFFREYWHGVVEFSATMRHFSKGGSHLLDTTFIPNDLSFKVNGHTY